MMGKVRKWASTVESSRKKSREEGRGQEHVRLVRATFLPKRGVEVRDLCDSTVGGEVSGDGGHWSVGVSIVDTV